MVLVAPSSKRRLPAGAALTPDNPLTLDENGNAVRRPVGSSLKPARRRRKVSLFGDEATQAQHAPRRRLVSRAPATNTGSVFTSWMLPLDQRSQPSMRSLDVATRLHRPMVNTRVNASSATANPRAVLAALTNAGLSFAPVKGARQTPSSTAASSITALTIAMATSSISTPVQRKILSAGRRTRFERALTLRDLWIDGVEPPARSPDQGKEYQACAVCKQVKSHPVSAIITSAPTRNYAEEAYLEHDHPGWDDHCRVSYSFAGLTFPTYM
ncbi:hypothetical protein C8F04DRAFT_1181509 [Mycena alexandri]|uniref:Uncharacterized protein n=1 Tax=Mycena alexandri TaxID=1745969 RepID=A0AAD6SY62_9AGAR|nr:hypothetical protein C8F04DRAFT_1181509 [Mycena alexandri]